ncbi:MAG: UDP-N-acetylmuramoyl-L-alanyl-D-glutamate--2,6-diaminopimelate ligase [Pseudomonadales bacterium]|nr:UDP-N-acetylmuramoyl-L-alanyl-D-glutamate--2,6-diaminopimelate ligase [Pseudomonadales bacterium]
MNTAENLNSQASLLELIEGIKEISDVDRLALQVVVTGVQMDSRLLEKGDLFLACFGRNHDARNYIDQAISSGCSAVLAESGADWQEIEIRDNVPIIAVDNLSAKISEIAARFYGHPSTKLSVIGITGTNGKTSCSQFIAQSLSSLGYKCGVIGTLGYGICGELKETQLTTPDAVFTQMALAEMASANVDPVAMEVSSVGLHQKRVRSVKFDSAVFTNLTRDHLDYHESMEAYGENKKKLFTMPGLAAAIVNLDDPFALSIINNISSNVEICTYSLTNKIATIYAESIELTRSGFIARVATPIGSGEITGKLIGYFNFSNVLAVIAALLHYLPRQQEASIDTICKTISELKPVDGRMEIIGESDDITAVVDYAHTPDGLRSALTALKDHFKGEVWCVFGCGGNRDKGKRPLMGEIAEKYSSHLVITDDNPRNEEGDEIVEHILCGINKPEDVSVVRDRAEAIAFAIANANDGDVVLVAGKGHETYQDIAGARNIFSDAKQVRLALQERDNKRSN